MDISILCAQLLNLTVFTVHNMLVSMTLNRLLKFPLQKLASMDMPSATLWELIYLTGRNSKILFRHPTIVM